MARGQAASGMAAASLLGGQPIEIGDEHCIPFTFADLHLRRLAEDALRQSWKRHWRIRY